MDSNFNSKPLAYLILRNVYSPSSDRATHFPITYDNSCCAFAIQELKRVLHCDMCSLNVFHVLLYNNAGVRKFSCFFGQHGCTDTWKCTFFFRNTIEKKHGNFHVPCQMFACEVHGNLHIPCHMFHCKVHGNFHASCKMFACDVHGNFHVPCQMFACKVHENFHIPCYTCHCRVHGNLHVP